MGPATASVVKGPCKVFREGAHAGGARAHRLPQEARRLGPGGGSGGLTGLGQRNGRGSNLGYNPMAHPLKMCSGALGVHPEGGGWEVAGKVLDVSLLGAGQQHPEACRKKSSPDPVLGKGHCGRRKTLDCGEWVSPQRGFVSQLSRLWRVSASPVIKTHNFWRHRWHVGTCL